MSNYRPISVLPLLSKIFEKCMASRVVKFLCKFSILSTDQYGFQKGISTCDAVSSLTNYLYDKLNIKHHSVALFLDLCKAYDTVDHGILLRKMYCYGFRGVAWRWFSSYLSNRQHCVKIGTVLSNRAITNISIPQGSVLGCYLFLIYINDLPKICNIAKPFLFADDTTLVMSNSNFTDLVHTFNNSLMHVNSWLIRNRLSLNINKTVAVIFSNRTASIDYSNELSINNNRVKYQTDVKYLGVIIDNALSFKSHINLVSNKISKNLGILYKLSNFVPHYVLRNIYYSLIYPYLTYCNLVWGGAASVHLNKLLLLQKRAVRIITNSEFLESTNPLFVRIKILKIADVHKYCCCLYAFKNPNKFRAVEHNHNTRLRSQYLVPEYQRLSSTQKSLSYKIPSVFNSLPDELKQIDKLKSFSTKLKQHFIDSYSDLIAQ